jgi:acetyl-CoA acetyltransferase family protein
MQDAVIVAGLRTAVGSFGGTLSQIPAPVLGARVIAALLEKTGIDPGTVDEVILGQVLAAGSGQNPARQAAMAAGLPASVPALTINKVCGSGLKAVQLAAQAIRCGDADIVIAGGQENMSAAPHVLPKSRNGTKMGDWTLIDSMLTDGLTDAFNHYHMGITAENIAEQFDISRAEQDAFAAATQSKAQAALSTDRFRHRRRAWQLASRVQTGRQRDRRQCLRHQRRRRRGCRHEREQGRGTRTRTARHDQGVRKRRGRSVNHGYGADSGEQKMPRTCWMETRRPRSRRGE